MVELIPGTVDAAREKHIPEVAVNGNCVEVKVGAVTHPMLDAHYIEWIYLQTKDGGQFKALKPGDAPKAEFCAADPVAVYEYCNLHGLWKNEL
jgi:superoxide reductase